MAHAFLASFFIFFLSVFLAFVYFNNYADIDFPSAKPTFENLGQDYLIANQENKSFTFEQNTISFTLETYPLCPFPHHSFGTLPLDLRSFVLRC